MTFNSKYLHEYAMKGTMGDWQSPVMVWLWALIDPVAPGAGSMFLLIVATFGWVCAAVAHAGIARQEGCAPVTTAGVDAAIPGPGRSHLAGRPVCNVLAARGRARVCGVRAAIMGRTERAGIGAGAGGFWRPAAAERLAGGADTRGLHGLSVAALVAQGGDPLRSRRARVLRHGAVRLLRHAGRETGASASDRS